MSKRNNINIDINQSFSKRRHLNHWGVILSTGGGIFIHMYEYKGERINMDITSRSRAGAISLTEVELQIAMTDFSKSENLNQTYKTWV